MSQLTRSFIGSGAAVVETLTGNTGGAVGPTANNINVLGGGGITVTGNPGTSTLTISNSSISYTYTNVNTSPYTVLTTDQYISVDCSGGPITVRLPNAATASQVFIIKDRTGNAAANNITVTTPGGAVLIDGAATFVMNTAYESINVIGNGTSYEVF